jgi:hypothetical protein
MFENRVLNSIFGPKKEEVVGGWRRLNNEELRDFYVSRNIIRVMKMRLRWARQVECRGEMKYSYRNFIGKPERNRPLGRSRHRWKGNIRMDLRVTGRKGED